MWRLVVLAISLAPFASCDTSHPPLFPQPSGEANAGGVFVDKAELFRMFQEGEFEYLDGPRCEFTAPGEKTVVFECGQILVGLHHHLSMDEAVDLVAPVKGTIARTSVELRAIMVSVEVGAERRSLLMLLKDPRARYVGLNISGPIQLSGLYQSKHYRQAYDP